MITTARTDYCYVDGEFVVASAATVPITDRSFLYGDGCFEGIGVVAGRILHLDDHVERLLRSCRALRIDAPAAREPLRQVVLETAARNRFADVTSAYLRVVVSRGSGYLGLRNTHRLGSAQLYVIPQVESRNVTETIDVYRAASTSIPALAPAVLDPRIKSNNYLWHILALLEAQDKAADLGIHYDGGGFVTECHASNIFCVKRDIVMTPPEMVALAGITRAHVLAVAAEIGFDVRELPLTRYDLLNADEVFVTGSLDLIGAVASIDGVDLPAPVPGDVTAAVRKAYLASALSSATPVPAA